MIILDTTITNVTRDFGRIEADVTLLIKWAGQPARPVRIHTNIPDRGIANRCQALIQDAAQLARHFHELPRVTSARAA